MLGNACASTRARSPYIEVTGTADMHIIPDEIFISITIRERNSGNQQSVKEQEEALKTALKGKNKTPLARAYCSS